ncbi:hypothetical protein [Tunturiibacter lichenicola]|uniref:hypothetical protein n=1 Tax=Tunturiibacter lichenicola TaxID=2051959 RepID=UPI003D9B8D45
MRKSAHAIEPTGIDSYQPYAFGGCKCPRIVGSGRASTLERPDMKRALTLQAASGG